MRNNILSRLHFGLRNPTWFILTLGMLAFIGGMLPDIDHPIAWLLGLDNGRFLHPHFDLAGAWFIICGSVLACALLGGYAITRVLKVRGRFINACKQG